MQEVVHNLLFQIYGIFESQMAYSKSSDNDSYFNRLLKRTEKKKTFVTGLNALEKHHLNLPHYIHLQTKVVGN